MWWYNNLRGTVGPGLFLTYLVFVAFPNWIQGLKKQQHTHLSNKKTTSKTLDIWDLGDVRMFFFSAPKPPTLPTKVLSKDLEMLRFVQDPRPLTRHWTDRHLTDEGDEGCWIWGYHIPMSPNNLDVKWKGWKNSWAPSSVLNGSYFITPWKVGSPKKPSD